MPRCSISVRDDLEQITEWLIEIVDRKNLRPSQVSLDFEERSAAGGVYGTNVRMQSVV